MHGRRRRTPRAGAAAHGLSSVPNRLITLLRTSQTRATLAQHPNCTRPGFVGRAPSPEAAAAPGSVWITVGCLDVAAERVERPRLQSRVRTQALHPLLTARPTSHDHPQMAPGPLAPADGPSAVKPGSGGGGGRAFGSQVDLASATEGLSLANGSKAQTLPPVAETPAKDAAVRCRGAAGWAVEGASLLPQPTALVSSFCRAHAGAC